MLCNMGETEKLLSNPRYSACKNSLSTHTEKFSIGWIWGSNNKILDFFELIVCLIAFCQLILDAHSSYLIQRKLRSFSCTPPPPPTHPLSRHLCNKTQPSQKRKQIIFLNKSVTFKINTVGCATVIRKHPPLEFLILNGTGSLTWVTDMRLSFISS